MTSLAFILGVTPLALANGAGAASQNAIGYAVIGGMLSATFLAILLVPVFFVVVSRRKPRVVRVEAENERDSDRTEDEEEVLHG
jgi:HAE1 family hydrophobic/amphiphilic exporter-1/multidrug efflux pump